LGELLINELIIQPLYSFCQIIENKVRREAQCFSTDQNSTTISSSLNLEDQIQMSHGETSELTGLRGET